MQSRRDEDTLKFCRLDGTPLVAAEASSSSQLTMALPASRPSEEITTGRLRVPFYRRAAIREHDTDPETNTSAMGWPKKLLNALAKDENLKVRRADIFILVQSQER